MKAELYKKYKPFEVKLEFSLTSFKVIGKKKQLRLFLCQQKEEFSTLLLNWQYNSLECAFKRFGNTSWSYPIQMALVLC